MIPRLFSAALFLTAAALLTTRALAAPPLTTIQDALYKADGRPFNGTLSISWNSFEAIDRSAIAMQAITTTVVNGILSVQLVPTTTATPTAVYTVKYNSDGRIQFEETWAVPSSVLPLRVRDVRIVLQALTGADVAAPVVQESDIVGLISDLGARPLKGPGYAPGRVAYVNPAGALESITGSLNDCVRVDGSSGPCGGTSPSFVDADSPNGIVDGANTSFTLTHAPNPTTSLSVYRNGMLQKTGQDYTFSGGALAFVSAAAPQPGDTLLASYRLAGVDSSAPQSYPAPQVLCSGAGGATSATTLASIGTCDIPAGLLAFGNRVEIRFDLEHQGAAGGFSFEVHWGATTLLHRDASAADGMATGRADAALTAAGAQLSSQSWGTALTFNAGVSASTNTGASGVAISFLATLAQAGDTVTLRNYTVTLVP